ncbi:pyridoxamine 5'-phosphate oxidase family protein [Vagococcus sp. BWB3-3]|uniref:Pyridoxamine 5'-phosphate oxidase family protein n=1 Tax=Vagococcus allomyrinae TaxID=2794353 RepID=A0A940P1D1_9ENTE|nr:pyridoxamine 5'-phosphate oxidase family protein [Vagococcus allomyrinae]MBP1039664.1 pyridoxamine 5'-phosphate oxidase family protein [Vagococcus allomyrinae]
MRRKERAIEELSEIKKLVEDCHVVRLAMFDEEYPYIVPVNYGYEWQGEELLLYIHGARQGKKVNLIQQHPKVAVEMDTDHELISGGSRPDKYSYEYRSLIGFGEAIILEDLAEKRHALQLLLDHTVKESALEPMPDKMVAGTAIIKISLVEYSVKQNKPKKSSNQGLA